MHRRILGAISKQPSAAKVPSRRTMSSSYPQPTAERAEDLRENIKIIKDEIAEAVKTRAPAYARSQRDPTLVLVSKLKPPSDLMAAYQTLGQDEKHFGENYVQEVRHDGFRPISF